MQLSRLKVKSIIMKKITSLTSNAKGKKIHSLEIENSQIISNMMHRCFLSGLIFVLLLLSGTELIAQSTYYSQGSTDINTLGNWNTVAGGGGSSPSDFTGTNSWIIQSGHSMTMSDNWTVGSGGAASVTIEGGLTVSSTYIVSITGNLIINGSLNNTGTYTGASAVTASSGININGTYFHARNGGYIPAASWSVSSICSITGVTDTPPVTSTLSQTFGNFTWNSPDQTALFGLDGMLQTVKGNFSWVNTGTGGVRLGADALGSLIIDGNYIQTGGVLTITNGTNARVVTVKGSFTLNGGGTTTLNMSSAASSATGTLYVAGNFTHISGGITENTSTVPGGSIVFNGTAMQTYTSGGIVLNQINFTVPGGVYLQMESSGTVVSGYGTFTLSSGGTLGITAIDGITANAATATGNIRTTTNRVFSTGANYIYNGTVLQVTGTGLTQNTPANLTIDNSAGVRLSAATSVSGLLTMTSGTLDMGNFNLTSGSLTGSGNITNSTGTATDVVLTTGSDGTSPAAYSGTISNGTANSVAVTKAGSGTIIFSGTNTYTGATTLSAGILQLGSGTGVGDLSKIVLNGGTFSTGASTGFSETAGTLDLEANSTIALGSGNHTLTLSASGGETWGSSAVLSITGWTGTKGQSGTAGKIFIGSGPTGLTSGQLAKINFNGYNNGAEILSSGEIVPISDPYIVISSSDPAVIAGNISQNTNNNVIYLLSIDVTLNDAVLNGLQIQTDVGYSAADLTNLKAWYSADNVFSSSSDVLLSAKTASLGPGTHIFPDWTNQFIGRGTTGYLFITADIPCSATANNEIYVMAVTTSDLSFTLGTKSGTSYSGGVQTIVDATPENVTSNSAYVADAQSVLSWINGCYDEIMIVAKVDIAVTGTPSGDGSAYTPNLVFSTGTGFDGGFVVYKGTTSPQTVTGLSNGSTYYYTFFSRKGSTWSNGVTTSAKAVAVGDIDYRSFVTGNWGDASTWEMTYDEGASWLPALLSPNSNNGLVTILNGHTVTVATGVTADQVTVAAGGQVNVASGVTLTVANGADEVDMSVSGILNNVGTVTATGALSFGDASSYIHARNGGSIPTASWAATSNCNITGIVDTPPTTSTFTQTFGNFTWDSPGQTALFGLDGMLQTVKGNFSWVNTGTGGVRLGADALGSLIIDGNYIQTGGVLTITNGTNARVVTVKGSFTLNGGGTTTLNMSSAASSSTGTLNVAGNFSHISGGITEFTSSGPGGSIVFNGTAIQTYTSGGVVNNQINFTVLSGASLQMAASSTTVLGDGTFTLSSGGTLGITSPDGVTLTGNSTGNIRTTTGRVFSTGANYIYNGSGAQVTGSAFPLTVNSLSVSATSNLSLSGSSLSVSDYITIGSGANLNIGASNQVNTVNFTNNGTMVIESAGVNSSGSFIASGTLTQPLGSTVTYNRYMPSEKWHYVSSPVNLTSTPSGSFYAWDEVAGDWEGTPTSTIESGKSYTLQTSGNTVAFTGKAVNSASVIVTSPYSTAYVTGTLEEYNSRWAAGSRVIWGGGGWNLLGNPFTSAMNAGTFISTNSDSFDPGYKALYIYDGTQYQYAAAIVPGFPIGSGFGEIIQAGQGFFILANYNGVAFSFTQVMQTPNSTVPMTKSGDVSIEKSEKTADAWPGLQLKVKYGEKEGLTTIVYNEEMNAGLDPGYDVGQFSAGPAVEIYTSLVSGNNGVNFTRQALPLIGCNKNIVPVGIDSEKGGEVTFSAFIVPLRNYKFFLEDRNKGIFTNLSNNSYTVTLPAKTYGAGRFFLHASANIPSDFHNKTENPRLLNVRVWASYNHVIIEGAVTGKATAAVFDLQGNKIFETRLSEGPYNTFTIPRVLKGVYTVKVTDGTKVVVRKVVFLNKR